MKIDMTDAKPGDKRAKSCGHQPKLSVIVPAYNAQGTIGRALKSVLAWEMASLEVIVVDDGSDDETAEIVGAMAAADRRLRLIRQANQGRSAARNRGFAEARAEWVMFMDSDDYLLEGGEKAVEEAMGEDVGLVVFPMVMSRSRGCVGWSDIAVDAFPGSVKNEVVGMRAVREQTLHPEAIPPCDADLISAFEMNSVCARLYRRGRLEQLSRRVPSWDGVFPPGVELSEDRLMNIGYLSLPHGGDVLLSNRILYYWDLEESRTTAALRAEYALGLVGYKDGVKGLEESGLLSRSEGEEDLGRQACFRLADVSLIPKHEMPRAVSIWKNLLHDEAVCRAVRRVHFRSFRKNIGWAVPLALLRAGLVGPAVRSVRLLGGVRRRLKECLRKGRGGASDA